MTISRRLQSAMVHRRGGFWRTRNNQKEMYLLGFYLHYLTN